MIPEKLGRFEVTGELGRGAMGVVYKGLDPKIQRPVGLKVINFQQTGGSDQLQSRERFLVEARATGQLSHPNILTIFDVGEEGDLAYIAMEYLEGGDLQDMIDQSKFEDYDQIFEIARQIAEGLEAAHSKGIIHRDIKPANILMLNGRIPKIADFGLARLADSNLTATGTVLGTPNYMAPEQIQGRKIDGRADLFALGALFYEMLTGEKPFGGETLTSVIYRVVNEEPIPPRQLTMDVPPAMDDFIKIALAKDPNERFQNAREFIVALKLLKEGKPMQGVSSAGSTQKLDAKALAAAMGKKNNMPIIIGGAVGVIALVVILLVLLTGGKDEKQEVAHVQETAKTTSELPVTRVEPPKTKQPTVPAEVKKEEPKKAAAPVIETAKETVEKEGKREDGKKEEGEKEKPKKAKLPTSNLNVTSTPEGAEVYINGKLMGETPYLNRRYKQKTFTLKVAMEGYEDYMEKFTLKGDRTFSISLNKTKETLAREAEEEKQRAESENLAAVKAEAEAEKKKAGTEEQTEKNKKGFFEKMFDPDMTRIVIEVKEGDRVSIDGKKYELETPGDDLGIGDGTFGDERKVEAALSVGKHNVMIKRKGKKTFLKVVRLKKGEVFELTPEFQ